MINPRALSLLLAAILASSLLGGLSSAGDDEPESDSSSGVEPALDIEEPEDELESDDERKWNASDIETRSILSDDSMENGGAPEVRSRTMNSNRLNTPGCGTFDAKRIVGGDEAALGSWPWQASIMEQTSNGKWFPFCGGALITGSHVLTAAHCLVGKRGARLRVRLGAREFTDANNVAPLGSDRTVGWFVIHSKYEKLTHTNDIAIMGLKEAPKRAGRPRTVCLPTNPRESFAGSEAVVTGHGLTNGYDVRSASTKLLEVNLQIFDNRRCSQVFKNVISSQLCAGSEEGTKASCQGDSGGPLMVADGDRYLSVGIVSYGVTGCTRNRLPEVLTRTSAYWGWIQKITRKWQ